MLLSGHVRSLSKINSLALFSVLASLLGLLGCDKSIHGLSEAAFPGIDKDHGYDPALPGLWTMTYKGCAVIINVAGDGRLYHGSAIFPSCDADETSKTEYYDAELFQLGQHKFLDITPRSEDVCSLCVEAHWIVEVDAGKDPFRFIDWGELDAADQEKTVTLPNSFGFDHLFTGSPKELKALCRKYGGDRKVFGRIPDFKFARR